MEMDKARYNVRLPRSIHADLKRASQNSGISISGLIAQVLHQRFARPSRSPLARVEIPKGKAAVRLSVFAEPKLYAAAQYEVKRQFGKEVPEKTIAGRPASIVDQIIAGLIRDSVAPANKTASAKTQS